MNEDPDDFWNWRLHNIDEFEWELDRIVHPAGKFHTWWFVAGAIIGIVLAVMA